jgi:hypothetical protein
MGHLSYYEAKKVNSGYARRCCVFRVRYLCCKISNVGVLVVGSDEQSQNRQRTESDPDLYNFLNSHVCRSHRIFRSDYSSTCKCVF